MTTTDVQPNQTLCACGCGEPIKQPNKSGYRRGHQLRDRLGKLTALPGPDDDLDAGEAEADLEDLPTRADLEDGLEIPDWLRPGAEPPPREPESAPDEVPADRPPGHLRSPRGGGKRGQGAGQRHRKPTATVQKDVQAKIRMMLMPAAQLWAIRDEVCGSVAVHQEPAVSEALAEIVCDSPDLLAFFTGPAGGFMKYFKLAMALQPVIMTAWAHHLSHARLIMPEGAAQQPPQMPAYAA